MRCQNCGKNNANINYTRIINGRRGDLHLCSECAKKLNIKFDFGYNEMFSDFFDDFSRLERMAIPDFAGFREFGRDLNSFVADSFLEDIPFFSNNYLLEENEDELDEVLNNIQKKHKTGKNQEEAKKSKFEFMKKKETKVEDKKQDEINQLKAKIQEYIKSEEYEKAAVLRDKIKKLES